MEDNKIMAIPKVIHYCWFGGGPLPPMAKKCIESWRMFLPDYEIREWNESNFNIEVIEYTRQAYSAKKYAFVSDYARFWILYNFGGLYFDTDVEVIKPLYDLIERGPFMGIESTGNSGITVAPGLGIGAEPKSELFKKMLSIYEGLKFMDSEGHPILKNIVEITTEYLRERGLSNDNVIQECCGFTIYPNDYFCPIDYETRELKITENTLTIHHYAESWLPTTTKIKNAIGRILGKKAMAWIVNLKKRLR